MRITYTILLFLNSNTTNEEKEWKGTIKGAL